MPHACLIRGDPVAPDPTVLVINRSPEKSSLREDVLMAALLLGSSALSCLCEDEGKGWAGLGLCVCWRLPPRQCPGGVMLPGH